MNLTTKKISTKALSSKADKVINSLKVDSYVVILVQPGRRAKPDAIILSNDLYNMLKGRAEVCDRLLQSPEFGELKSENSHLRRVVDGLMAQLRKRMGENERFDEDAWEEIKESVIEVIQRKVAPWTDVEPDDIDTAYVPEESGIG